jgi:imidazolonepropionase-like amidohydrolase
MLQFGMTPMQALRSATIDAAEVMGWRDRVGSITPGKFADLVAIAGEGLGDMSAFADVQFVMRGGIVEKGLPE